MKLDRYNIVAIVIAQLLITIMYSTVVPIVFDLSNALGELKQGACT
jgi:hypothetical protein